MLELNGRAHNVESIQANGETQANSRAGSMSCEIAAEVRNRRAFINSIT